MDKLSKELKSVINEIKNNGLYKAERILSSKQNSEIEVNNKSVLNFCANNYLGLSNNKQLIVYAQEALEKFGFGLSSVRFICGTQSIHKELENKISGFLEKEDTILYSSCFDANGGLFETLLDSDDVIITVNPEPNTAPVANAGDDMLIILPETTAILSGDLSHDDDTNTLNYYWEQIYGPSVVIFSDQYIDNPEVFELVEGTYKFKLTVDDGEHFSSDYVSYLFSFFHYFIN